MYHRIQPIRLLSRNFQVWGDPGHLHTPKVSWQPTPTPSRKCQTWSPTSPSFKRISLSSFKAWKETVLLKHREGAFKSYVSSPWQEVCASEPEEKGWTKAWVQGNLDPRAVYREGGCTEYTGLRLLNLRGIELKARGHRGRQSGQVIQSTAGLRSQTCHVLAVCASVFLSVKWHNSAHPIGSLKGLRWCTYNTQHTINNYVDKRHVAAAHGRLAVVLAVTGLVTLVLFCFLRFLCLSVSLKGYTRKSHIHSMIQHLWSSRLVRKCRAKEISGPWGAYGWREMQFSSFQHLPGTSYVSDQGQERGLGKRREAESDTDGLAMDPRELPSLTL